MIESGVHIPKWFVKGVAPNGKEYPIDTRRFAKWMAARPDAEFPYDDGLNDEQVRTLWQCLGRTDVPPKHLEILILENSEFESLCR
jgi:hypothetical protein